MHVKDILVDDDDDDDDEEEEDNYDNVYGDDGTTHRPRVMQRSSRRRGGGGGDKGSSRDSVFRSTPTQRSTEGIFRPPSESGVEELPFRRNGRIGGGVAGVGGEHTNIPLRNKCNSNGGGRQVLDNDNEHDSRISESHAPEILLSLSKSFERGTEEGGGGKENRVTTRRSRNTTGDDGAMMVRPPSLEEPPRIQHYHKLQPSDTFEPQPSPMKPSHSLLDNNTTNGVGEDGVALSSSFALFNTSFDMNLEGLLGTDASFGFGPTGSLSFGLGIGNGGSIDYGEGGGTTNSSNGNHHQYHPHSPPPQPALAQRWKHAHQALRMSPVRMMASDDDEPAAATTNMPSQTMRKREGAALDEGKRISLLSEPPINENGEAKKILLSSESTLQMLTASDSISSAMIDDGVASKSITGGGKRKRLAEHDLGGNEETTAKRHSRPCTVDKLVVFGILERHSVVWQILVPISRCQGHCH